MATKDSATPYQKLMAGRLWASRQMPYFTSALYLMMPREHTNFPPGSSMGVTENGFLLWNPEEVGKRDIPQVGTTLLHEVNHWVRGHHKRMVSMAVAPEDFELWNIAGDCEIDDDLKAARNLSPMKQWFYPETIGAKEGLTAEAYYSHLKKSKKPPAKGSGKEGS